MARIEFCIEAVREESLFSLLNGYILVFACNEKCSRDFTFPNPSVFHREQRSLSFFPKHIQNTHSHNYEFYQALGGLGGRCA